VKGTALVTGPHGLIGSHVCEQLTASGEWEVIGASRRESSVAGVEQIRLDLTEAEIAAEALAPLSEVTHLVFAAYAPDRDPLIESERNLALLANTVRALRGAGARLRHLTIYQGAKAYGAHLGPFPTPALESDPRVEGPLFYYPQEDFLREDAGRHGYDFTVLRPDFILGLAEGNAINLLLAAAVYGAYCEAEAEPFRFPGSPRAYEALIQMTSADLLARATEWAMTAPAAANQVFNVTNGDHVRWSRHWPLLAELLGLPCAEPRRISLTEWVGGRPQLWRQIVRRHDLRRSEVGELLSWEVADFMLNLGWDVHSSTVKIRLAGFGECVDTAAELERLVSRLRRERWIPKAAPAR
jgi:nucleoside-diphosphate-sugar epimerase